MKLMDKVTKTQHQKILELCADGQFHCQAGFWLISKSPHKRRDDIKLGKYKGGEPNKYEWDERPCIHGIKNSKDFKLIPVSIPIPQFHPVKLTKDFPEQMRIEAMYPPDEWGD